ncbi:MAG: hypothetical protein HFI93_06820 [Lachnospiraceae bacterium]|nr:hypothetical protein [Lachnospiraceae bacterium]
MEMHFDDFQSLYRRYAYPVYREVFEELKNVDETREVVSRIFTRMREEEDAGVGVEERLVKYRVEYVAERIKAQLEAEGLRYRMRNDEILGRRPEERVWEEPEDFSPNAEEAYRELPEEEPENPKKRRLEELFAGPEEEWPRRLLEMLLEEPEESLSEEPPIKDENDLLADLEVWQDEQDAQRMFSMQKIRQMYPEEEEEEREEVGRIGEEEPEPVENPAESRAEAEDSCEIRESEEEGEPEEEKRPEEAGEPEEERAESEAEGPKAEEAKKPENPEKIGNTEGAKHAKKSKGAKNLLGYWILFGIILLAFFWFFLNILMSLQILPVVDLGYSWFNNHVVTLFPVS